MTSSPPSAPARPSLGRRLVRAVLLIILVLLAVVLLVVAVAGFFPIHVENPVVSRPAADYDDALAQIEGIQAEEDELGDLFPVCHSILMTHGRQVEDVIVFYHGFTNCPEQYRQLSEAFFAQGYNVYVPLAPFHGRTDRHGTALRDLTDEDLAAHATTTADIAQGLGRRVTVSGLSGGGTIAAWLAQERADIALAAPNSPFIGVKLLPGTFLNRGLANLLRVLPNVHTWWDPITQDNNPNTAPHAYTAYPLRSMGTYMRLGFSALADAGRTPPGAAVIRMVLNDADTSVSNRVAENLVTAWQRGGAADADTFTFDRAQNLPHDMIAPQRLGAATAEVYATLIDLLTGAVGP